MIKFWSGQMSIAASKRISLTEFMGVPVLPEIEIEDRLNINDVPHFMYRLRMDAIKYFMRQDLEHMLDDFAARWGIER